jgi:hypothetical protein
VPNLERGWDLESATALAAVGPRQAGLQGGDGRAPLAMLLAKDVNDLAKKWRKKI